MSARDIETIREAAVRVGETSLGVTKAFISDVHAELLRAGSCNLGLGAFKAWLIREQKYGDVNLSRCDLVEHYDAATVAASECSNGVSEYHFVRF